MRALFGTLCISVASWGFFGRTALERGITVTTPTSNAAMAVCLGYFIVDFIALIFQDVIFKRSDVILMTHHLLCVITMCGCK